MALADNLVAYWKLDEVSGNRADSVGTNTLTDVNTVASSTTNKQGGRSALFASATSEALSIVDNAALSAGDVDFTFACWVNPTATIPTFPAIASKGWAAAAGVNREWIIFYDRAATTLWFSYQTPLTASGGISMTITLVAGTWYYIVIWHDSVGNTVNLQVNNGTVTSLSMSEGIQDGAGPFKLGSSDPAHGLFWNGLIDEAAFWKRVLPAQDRTDLYNGGAGIPYPFPTVAGQPTMRRWGGVSTMLGGQLIGRTW